MMYGITFRGRHSREFGLVVKSKSRPAAPPVRTQEDTASLRDGAVDYSMQGGRLYYDDKFLELELTVPRKELQLTQKAVSKIVSWLTGWYGEMVFDDMPHVIWIARPVDLSEVGIELYRVGKVTVQFRCKPFNRLKYSTTGIPLDSDLSLDFDVPLDYGEDAYHNLEAGENTIAYSYIGDAPVAPKLIIFGSGVTQLKFTLNGYELQYIGSIPFDTMTIDCETWRTYADELDITQSMSGDYGELTPGENALTITTDRNAELAIVCYPHFMYGDVGFEQEEETYDSSL